MKDYTVGLLRHRCSNKMRVGKLIKIFSFTSLMDRKACPNCHAMIRVKNVSFPVRQKVIATYED